MALEINLGLTATATGTVDIITATYSPAPTLVDKKILFLVASGANTSTTPTFNPNGLSAWVITKRGGSALSANDIPAAGFVAILVSNLANTRWELLNPGSSYTLAQVLAAGNKTNELDVISNNTRSIIKVLDAGGVALVRQDASARDVGVVTVADTTVQSTWSDGVQSGESTITATSNKFKHSVKNIFDAPIQNFPQSTALTVPYLDASKNLVSSAVTPTQLGYLDATSSIQTQLNTKEVTSAKDATGGYAGLTLFKINFKNALNTITSFFTNSNTAARTYTFQDRDGTIADDADLAGKNAYYIHTGSTNYSGWYGSFLACGAPTTVATTTGFLLATPFVLSSAKTMDEIVVNVTVAGTAGSVIRVGIYSDNGNCFPGALLLDAGTVTGDTVAVKTITINQVMPAGLYWLVYEHNSAASITVSALSATGGSTPSVMGYVKSAISSGAPNRISATLTYAVLPANFPTTSLSFTNSTIPLILLHASA